jgi:hypothetical protein
MQASSELETLKHLYEIQIGTSIYIFQKLNFSYMFIFFVLP